MPSLRSLLHSLRRAPVYTVVALTTLAFGIALNTSMASLLDALLFRPAPFAEPARLVRIEGLAPDGTEAGLSVPEIDALESGLGSLATAAPFRWVDTTLTEANTPAENFVAVATTGSFFEVLGVAPLVGRTFNASDLAAPDTPVAVLGHDLWLRRFGGDRSIVGKTVRLNGRTVTVLGVMPPSFGYRRLWGFAELFVPGAFRRDARTNFEARQHALLVRLSPAATEAELRTRLAAIGTRFAAEHPQTNTRRSFRANSLHGSTVAPTLRRLSFLVTAVSAVVLLIVGVNLANLQLSRALDRQREHAVRAALGASPRRLFAQQLGESFALGVAGAVGGLLLALWINRLLSDHLVVGVAGRVELRLDATVFTLSLGLALLASLAAGSAPAFLAARADVNDTLKRQARGNSGSPAQRRLRHGLIVGEIALALTLMTGAGILIRSVQQFLGQPVGWRTENIAFGTVTLPRATYETRDARRAFHRRLEQELRAETGVERAALSSLPPLFSYWNARNYFAEGRTGGTDARNAFYVPCSPGFFATAGIEFVAGQGFAEAIRADDPPVAVINESLARALWPGENAVGRRLADAGGRNAIEIVGVVRDVAFPANIDAPVTPYQVYQPFIQDPWSYITISVRGPGKYGDLAAAMRRAVARIDPDVPVQDIVDTAMFVARQQRNLQLLLRALSVFAAAGLALAALGVYGVVAHGVAQRRTEFGIRLALGASPRAVAGLVVGLGGRLAALGVLFGSAGAFAFAHFLERALPRVADASPALFITLAAAMFAVTLLASWLPARRASRVDPLTALRAE